MVDVLQTGQLIGHCTNRVYALEQGDRRYIDKRDWESTFRQMSVMELID